jgi:hypothetical protein
VQPSAARRLRLPPTLDNHLSVASPSRAWLRWTELRYRLPPAASKRRVPVWRALRALHGVCLDAGVWAIPHTDRGSVDLGVVDDLVARAGGQTDCDAVGSASIGDIERHLLLARTCERVWDEFLLDADRLAVRVSAGVGDSGEHHHALLHLRERFGSLLASDLVGSDASTRAAMRLDAVSDAVHERCDAEPAGGPGPRVRVVVRAGWALDDGSARYVLALQPTPALAWERAFERFEAAVYAPDPARISLRHGASAVACSPADLHEKVRAVQERVRHFERSID